MTERNENLQRLLDAIEAAVWAKACETPSVGDPGVGDTGIDDLADRIFAALREPGGANAAPQVQRPPVCAHLTAALDVARAGPAPLPELADAFAAVEARLAWQRRQGSEEGGRDFADNHANAVIVGADGLEAREDVRVGASLVAPGIEYPRHRHPPEELYVVLSAGQWRQNDGAWLARSSGGLVHNPPHIWHAMRAGEVPLLAIWCLWTAA